MTDYEPTRIEEPHEVWRFTLVDGRTVYAVIAMIELTHCFLWFVNGRIADSTGRMAGFPRAPNKRLPREELYNVPLRHLARIVFAASDQSLQSDS